MSTPYTCPFCGTVDKPTECCFESWDNERFWWLVPSLITLGAMAIVVLFSVLLMARMAP